jgi:hypothetical protein
LKLTVNDFNERDGGVALLPLGKLGFDLSEIRLNSDMLSQTYLFRVHNDGVLFSRLRVRLVDDFGKGFGHFE